MKLIEQSHEIINLSSITGLLRIEMAGRTCYKSESELNIATAKEFAAKIIKMGHESVIEHASATVRFITNRGVTHELVRHRLAAYSQESTRYVNYGGDDIEFIAPVWYGKGDPDADNQFWWTCKHAEDGYKKLLEMGWRPEQAREVLPNALKTEIVMTANYREWRHVFRLRCSKKAHPQIRALMLGVYQDFHRSCPEIFGEDLIG